MATEKDKDLQKLLDTLTSSKKEDRELVTKAYDFAKRAHENQQRLSGKPYFFHTLQTAQYLAELGMDAESVMAGLLHDTIEEECATTEEIAEKFGENVLFLVEGVTKLGKLKYHGLERHAESLRKLFVAMAHDIRVIIIRLADRLHNIQTLQYVPKEKQRRIALETLEIYAPLAHRLGIGSLKGQLEDTAFPYVYPEEYAETKKLHSQKSKEHVKLLKKINKMLLRMLAEEKITVLKTDYRVKHLYSLWQKLKRKHMNVEKVYDIAALRVIVPTVEDCYRALGIIHKRWKPLPKRIKDYIATPKPNSYRSLHTTIFTGDGNIVEIQIRTPEMHQEAEYGIASHVSYKGMGKESNIEWLLRMLPSPFQKNGNGKRGKDTKEVDVPQWLEHLSKIHDHTESPQEFLHSIKSDFFKDRTFVFTPKGEVIDLPTGATAIDFAYAIHTDIGDHLDSVKINGKLSSIDSILENGDIVDVITKESAHPTAKWLDHTVTTLARRHIRAQLKETI